MLEFGGAPTASAAKYVPELCKQWAIAMSEAAAADTTTTAVLTDTTLHGQGRVRRHSLRGTDVDTAKETRLEEDLECRAGARNAADLVLSWPRLWRTMAQVHTLSGCSPSTGWPPRMEETRKHPRSDQHSKQLARIQKTCNISLALAEQILTGALLPKRQSHEHARS